MTTKNAHDRLGKIIWHLDRILYDLDMQSGMFMPFGNSERIHLIRRMLNDVEQVLHERKITS